MVTSRQSSKMTQEDQGSSLVLFQQLSQRNVDDVASKIRFEQAVRVLSAVIVYCWHKCSDVREMVTAGVFGGAFVRTVRVTTRSVQGNEELVPGFLGRPELFDGIADGVGRKSATDCVVEVGSSLDA